MTLKQSPWKDFQTLQSKEILTELMEAKQDTAAKMIISSTGLGKTNTIKLFNQKFAEHTYTIVVGDSYRLEDVLMAICKIIGVEIKETSRYMSGYKHRELLSLITDKLVEIAMTGGRPMIILDEAENLKPGVLKTIKELYDAVIHICSIVLIGTDQILDSMLNRRNKNRTSVPQLYRRFKAGIRHISPLNKGRDFAPFFQAYCPHDEGVKALLIEHADNYGELHDFLEPVLRYCEKKGTKITEDIFRLYHKIPKRK